MRRLDLATLLMIIAVGACYPAGSQESPELAAMSAAFADALNAGDIEAIAMMYTEDARLMPPNLETGVGRDFVRAAFGGMYDAGLRVELETVEAMASGDMGYRIGTYVLTGPDGSFVDKGKFVEIRQKIGGEWLMTNDTWNSDLPVPNMLITHEVTDADRWLAAWRGPDSRKGMFAEGGAPAVRVFQNIDNPNLTALLVGITDIDAFQAMLESDEGAAAKAADGVLDPTMQVFTEVQ
jgi:ketosteroid isomerase-like protein